MFTIKRFALAIVAATLHLSASAEKREVWHGWSAMPGLLCTKTFYYKDSFGIKWPSVKSANQEHHTRIYANLPTWGDVEGKVKECALIASSTAGAAAFLATPATAWPAFKGAFAVCASQKALNVSSDVLQVSAGTVCKW